MYYEKIRFIEEWGTGISRIIKSCTEAALEEPEFIETGMFFKVVIKKKSSDKVLISSDKIQLSDSENKIIQYLKKNESITNKESRAITNLSSSGVRKVFDSLVQKNLIVPIGDNKSRYYVLNENKQ